MPEKQFRIFFGVGLFLIGLLPGIVVGQQQSAFLLSDTTRMYRVDASTEVLIDTTNALTIDDIVQSGNQSRFNVRGNLTFGYLKPALWLKITTQTHNPRTRWYLEIPAPFLEYVDFYQAEATAWKHSRSGYYVAHSERMLSHTGHVLPLHFNSDSNSTVYIKITGLSPKTFPVYIMEESLFNNKIRWDDIYYGSFFGILLVMFFYNLFIYLSLRQSTYLLYICTIVCTFAIFSSASGYGGKFLWPEHPGINFFTGRLSLGVLAIILAVFTIRFLEVKKYSLIMFRLLLGLIPLAVVSILLLQFKWLSSAGNNIITLSTILFLTTGIVCRIKGNRTATFYIAAWSIYLTGGLLLTLRNSGVFDFNFWTTHFVEIGAVLETSIIAFALGDRYRQYKEETEQAQRIALKVQQDATEKLELKVKERTHEIILANTELKHNLEIITRQSQTIENKNAELDAFFYRISHDLKGPISSLLGLSNLAQLEITDPTAREYLTRQHAQVERLKNIIGGLINLTKLNHDTIPKEPIDFNRLVDECIHSLESVDNFSKVEFRKEIDHTISIQSYWILLNAILQNLIENAIKYAQEEKPYVRIAIKAVENHLIIEVEDNGQGIPEAQQDKIFEMFYRATQQANGSGLGLYILKRSVDRLNGTIEINSAEGTGSTFRVKVPTA